MSRPLLAVATLACAVLLVLPAGAWAEDPADEIPDIAASAPQAVTSAPAYGIARASAAPPLWATVNICDTRRAPDSMGVRASMPGNGTRQRMYMRFTAEYWSRANQAWTPVAGSGVSPWVFAGSAKRGRRQAGWTFSFAAPPAGAAFTMRAHVEFEWRARHARAGRRGHRRSKRGRRKRSGRTFDLRRARPARARVIRSVTRTTETGVRGADGGDPAGTSKAMCLIY